MRFVEAIYAVTQRFPKEESFGLTNQMRRAAVSVPSNIAEGQGRDSDKSFAQFLKQAQGSLYELETQVELARNLGMIPEQGAKGLLTEAAEIGRMLHGLRSTLRRDTAPTG
jgi:four helix bundle protein